MEWILVRSAFRNHGFFKNVAYAMRHRIYTNLWLHLRINGTTILLHTPYALFTKRVLLMLTAYAAHTVPAAIPKARRLGIFSVPD
jgi:hypothetical protein